MLDKDKLKPKRPSMGILCLWGGIFFILNFPVCSHCFKKVIENFEKQPL